MTPYLLKRSRRRTVSLEITREGTVLVRAPLRLSQEKIESFVAAHEKWIDEHLARQQQRRRPEPTEAEIAALREQAKALLPGRVAYWSEKMGVRPTGLKITAARTRFGSCSGKNSLCFSLFLLRYPPPAVDYVVVHELAHIRHKNHGREFYAFIASVMPDYKERIRLLKG
ncbi:MAG: M48 family metallopeptidase [Clostridiales bacterium]|nr:M48 family metallopeptidase [Clostridiales bacterium]